MKKKSLKKFQLAKKQSAKNSEGVSTSSFVNLGYFDAEAYNVTGKLQVELYGIRVNGMLNLLTQSKLNFEIGDGVYINKIDVPDYHIVTIETFTFHKRILIESVH